MQGFVHFQLYKSICYGKAIFVCGSLVELGNWQPQKALRLKWNQGDRWQADLQFSINPRIQKEYFDFKFIISDWEGGGNIEWQIGSLNRRIYIESIRHESMTYRAEWNRQHYIFLLKAQQLNQNFSYFIKTNLDNLRVQQNLRAMRHFDSKTNNFLASCRQNPQLIGQDSFLKVFMSQFSLQRNIQEFVYSYILLPHLSQYQIQITDKYQNLLNQKQDLIQIKNIYSMEKKIKNKQRIVQFDWEGCKVIVDEIISNNLIIGKFTNQIYLCRNIKNKSHILKLLEKKVTVLILAFSRSQNYPSQISQIQGSNEYQGLSIISRPITSEKQAEFGKEIQSLVNQVEQLVINGHRVCISFGRKIMKEFVIATLYEILFESYSLEEALCVASIRSTPSKELQNKVRSIYNHICTRCFRGRGYISEE